MNFEIKHIEIENLVPYPLCFKIAPAQRERLKINFDNLRLSVMPLEKQKGKYLVLHNQHLIDIAKELGRKKLPCIIENLKDKTEVGVKNYVYNQFTDPVRLSTWQRYLMAKELIPVEEALARRRKGKSGLSESEKGRALTFVYERVGIWDKSFNKCEEIEKYYALTKNRELKKLIRMFQEDVEQQGKSISLNSVYVKVMKAIIEETVPPEDLTPSAELFDNRKNGNAPENKLTDKQIYSLMEGIQDSFNDITDKAQTISKIDKLRFLKMLKNNAGWIEFAKGFNEINSDLSFVIAQIAGQLSEAINDAISEAEAKAQSKKVRSKVNAKPAVVVKKASSKKPKKHASELWR